MSRNPFLARRSLLSVSVTTALGAMVLGGMAPGAMAQEDESLEEVVITGSRIVRRDFESNSPIVTVDSGDFEQQAGLNIESFLNQLPTYNPAASPVTTQGDVQITPVNSVGIASISLRGFGPNRSLVLVNGKRPTPINALMVTDVHGVPSALVQRVETITGGASAVYGADAIGGGHEQWIFKSGRLEVEERAEPAQGGFRSRPAGRTRQRLYPVDEGVSRIDIHPGLGVGKAVRSLGHRGAVSKKRS